MSGKDFKKYWNIWYTANKSRLKHLPELQCHNNGMIFVFKDITNAIDCTVDYELQLTVSYQEECWDGLVVFVFPVIQEENGLYYCIECEEFRNQSKVQELSLSKKYFQSCEELWSDHCFEPFLEWINENFVESNCIALFAVPDCTWAMIVPQQDAKKVAQKKYFLTTIPIIRDN